MTRKKKILLASGATVVLGGLAFAGMKLRQTEGVAVSTEPIQRRHLEAIVSASGKIQPKRSVNISADTSGRVTDLAVNEGDRVAKGQFLLQIDPRNLRTRVQSGEASLSAARSQAEGLKLAMEAAKVALQQAEDAAARQRQLWKQGLTTKEALERAEAELQTRHADLRTQEQQVRTQQLRMRQESAALDSARYDLNKVRIESPIDGIVTRRNIEAGETAIIGTMNNPGTVLLTIADMSVIEAEVDVDETDIPSVALGQKATITIDALPGKTFTGRVTEIGNSPIQPTGQAAASEATNFKVVLTLDGEIPDVRPGFTCSAEITTAVREHALSVPIQATTVREVIVDAAGNMVRDPKPDAAGARRSSGAVQAAELKAGQTRKELEGVFVVRGDRAEFVPIKTGIPGEKYFEVLSGLEEGDKVIVGPFASVRELKDGALVKDEGAASSRK